MDGRGTGDRAHRAGVHARAELEAYERELPEYRARAGDPRSWAETPDIGRKRAEDGFSAGAAQRVLALHATLMLREINEVAEGGDLAELLRLTAWFGEQGARGSGRYLDGYLAAQRLRLSLRKRLHDLVDLLLAGDLSAPGLARDLGVRLPGHYLAVVMGFPGRPPGRADAADDLVESVFKLHAAPVAWRRPDELLALLPACPERETAVDDALPVVRDIAEAVARPAAPASRSARPTGWPRRCPWRARWPRPPRCSGSRRCCRGSGTFSSSSASGGCRRWTGGSATSPGGSRTARTWWRPSTSTTAAT
ncbi:hypothetical protein [Amycolatopsis rifamycinica]|uniref:hypothetical protein n=1 Tax=Amycolatopsis rifamycinica TaxID=287986 RepID=UPI000AFB14D8|nr:hypothetical protein [Amycolatopsis rifamycinica]